MPRILMMLVILLVGAPPAFGERVVNAGPGADHQQYAMLVIADWIQVYDYRCPHMARGLKSPAEAYDWGA